MSPKYIWLLMLLSAIVSASITKFYFPQIQTKTVEVTKEVTHTDIQTVTHTVTKGGETDTTTVITDHTQHIESDNKTAVTIKKADWMVSGLYTIDIHTAKPIYGADIKYRLFDSLFIGGMLDTTGQPRVTLGVTF